MVTAVPRRSLFIVHGFFGVLIHLRPAALYLRQTGAWEAEFFGYRSRVETIDAGGALLARRVAQCLERDRPTQVGFLTHSMGGVVLRSAVARPEFPEAARSSRAVLLGPPLRGSSFARMLTSISVVSRHVMGSAAGKQLMETAEEDFVRLHAPFPPEMRILVIAGTRSHNPFLREPNDGVITVRETEMDIAHRRLVLPVRHVMLPLSPTVLRAARDFLNGQDVGEQAGRQQQQQH